MNTIAIVGPSTSGKTDAAIAYAHRHKSALVCADMLQIYKGFKIGAGAPTAEQVHKLPTALYGFVRPGERLVEREHYHQLASIVRGLVIEKGNTAVFDGCSSIFAQALLDTPAQEHGAFPVFCIYPSLDGLDKKLQKRMDVALEMGLVNEVKELLDKGYGNTAPMKAGLAYKMFSRYLKGNISKDEAIELTLEKARNNIEYQCVQFRKVDGLIPIEADEPEAIAEQLETKVQRFDLRNLKIVPDLQTQKEYKSAT